MISPIIFLLLIWFGFKVLVVNQTIDIKPLISFLTKKIEVFFIRIKNPINDVLYISDASLFLLKQNSQKEINFL
jgi:vesicle coat complex subunit